MPKVTLDSSLLVSKAWFPFTIIFCHSSVFSNLEMSFPTLALVLLLLLHALAPGKAFLLSQYSTGHAAVTNNSKYTWLRNNEDAFSMTTRVCLRP